MAEFEVYARLDGEIAIDIDTESYTLRQKLVLIKRLILGQTLEFEDVYVELEGDTIVEIEPQDRY